MKTKRFKILMPIVAVILILAVLVFAVPSAAATLPTVTTSAASGVGANTATLNGNITSVGDRYVMFKGFKWGTATGVYTKFWHTGSWWTQQTTGAFTHAPTDLVAGTTYYYKAYCTYRWGTVYGTEQNFTTTGAAASTVTTAAVADPEVTTALLGGNITATGGGKVWWRGVEWGIATGVYTDSWTSKKFYGNGYTTGAFTHTLTGLTTATTYYYRANCCTLAGSTSVSLSGADEGTALWSSGMEMPLSPKYLDRSSVELKAAGSGDDGSTHLEFAPIDTITLEDFQDNLTDYSFWHYTPAVSANWAQFELRFVDPTDDGWVEVTAVGLQNYTGTAAWVEETLGDATLAGYGGWGEAGSGASFFNWGPLTALSGIEAAINAEGNVTNASDWVLERVRVELWEASPARTCYIDDVTIGGTTYFIEGWPYSFWSTRARTCYAGIWGYGSEVNFTTD
jgi:hypothetical protein